MTHFESATRKFWAAEKVPEKGAFSKIMSADTAIPTREAGAAITITVLSLAAVNTLGIQIDITSAILLSLLAAVSACGTSGVAGGSLLLIPLACSLFGISNDVAMQVVAIGLLSVCCKTRLKQRSTALPMWSSPPPCVVMRSKIDTVVVRS